MVCQYVQRNSIILPSKVATNVVKGAFEGNELEDGGEPDVCGSGVVCFLIDLSEAGGRVVVQRNSIIPPSKTAMNVGKGAFESYGLEDGGEPDVCGSVDTGRARTLPASGDREMAICIEFSG